MNAPKVACPKCGADITDSYDSSENEDSGWWCETCDAAEGYVPDLRDPE